MVPVTTTLRSEPKQPQTTCQYYGYVPIKLDLCIILTYREIFFFFLLFSQSLKNVKTTVLYLAVEAQVTPGAGPLATGYLDSEAGFPHFDQLTDPLEILLECSFWFSEVGVGPLQSDKLPGSDAIQTLSRKALGVQVQERRQNVPAPKAKTDLFLIDRRSDSHLHHCIFLACNFNTLGQSWGLLLLITLK